MGPKKKRNRQMAERAVASTPSTRSENRPRWPLALVVLVAGAALVWAVSARRSATPAATVTTSAESSSPPPPAPAAVEPLPAHVPTDAELPPLPTVPFQPARPMDVVEAVYRFAAQHPEVMRYVPCFCGCEHSGHRDNEDCFVSARGADGRVTWNPHGMGCAICIDVARQAMQMHASGAGVADIRAAIDRTWTPTYPTSTPTPPAPGGE
jgi:hypothetical protein